jgi:hypothetical protein
VITSTYGCVLFSKYLWMCVIQYVACIASRARAGKKAERERASRMPFQCENKLEGVDTAVSVPDWAASNGLRVGRTVLKTFLLLWFLIFSSALIFSSVSATHLDSSASRNIEKTGKRSPTPYPCLMKSCKPQLTPLALVTRRFRTH